MSTESSSDQWHESFERIVKTRRAALPVSSENGRKAASKETARSRAKQKSVGRSTGGVRKRRIKRGDL